MYQTPFKTFSLSLTSLLLPLLISGCAAPKYACGVPDGIGCKPLSEVHRMAKDGTLKMKAAPNNREDEKAPLKKRAAAQADVMKLVGDGRSSSISTAVSNSASGPEAELMTPVISDSIISDKVITPPDMPTLIPPRTLRVWVARWPDENGTLHHETYLYLRLDNGRWLME